MIEKNAATSHTLNDTKTSAFMGINPLLERNGASLTLIVDQPNRTISLFDSKGMEQLRKILTQKNQALSSKK